MRIITRAEWGARPPKSTPRKIATPSKELWLHHTASPSGGAERVRAIQNFHMDVRKWNDIAYSFLVNHLGEVYEGRGAGIAGGHTAGHNTISHAICVLGHYDQTQPTQAALDAVVELAAHGHDKGWWPQLFTGGHRDASGANTSCPGKNLYSKIPEINEELEMPTAEEIAQAVWNTKVKRAGTLISAIQELADCKSLLLGLSQDANNLTDAELEAAVDDLIAALPAATLNLLKEKL